MSHDNVTLNPTYERILKFYGYDVDSFNNALIPDIYTSTAGSPVSTEATDTTEETIPEATVVPAPAATTNVPEVPAVTEIPEEEPSKATTVVMEREETTPVQETSRTTARILPVTIPVVEITTPFIENEETTKIIPVVEVTTTPAEEQSSSTIRTPSTTVPLFRPQTFSPIQPITTTSIPITITTTKRITIPTEPSMEPFTSVLVNASENAEATAEVAKATTKGESVTQTTPASTVGLEKITTVKKVPENTEASAANEVDETPGSTIMPLEGNRAESTTPTSIQPTTIEVQQTTIPMEVSTVSIKDPEKPTTPVTLKTNEERTTLPPEEVEIFNATKISPVTTTAVPRVKRSIIDYLIARYYDGRHITRPSNYTDVASKPPRTFLVDGTRREPVHFMTYDTVLPFYYVPNLEALALSFPLDNTNYYLLLLLPVQEDGVDDLICEMKRTPDLKYIIRNLKYTRVKAVIPSFMLKGYVNLTPTLQKVSTNTYTNYFLFFRLIYIFVFSKARMHCKNNQFAKRFKSISKISPLILE